MLFVVLTGISDIVFFFKQKTAYEMRISDWSSDVCSSDLAGQHDGKRGAAEMRCDRFEHGVGRGAAAAWRGLVVKADDMPAAPLAQPHMGRARRDMDRPQIGRASCRERVCQDV